MSSSNTEESRLSPRETHNFLQFVIYLLFFFGPLTGNVILVLFNTLSEEFSVSISEIQIAISAFMFPFAITQLFSGVISDIKGRFPVLFIGLILFGVAMLLATFSFSLILYVIANILGGIGFGFVNPVLISLMTDISEPQEIPKKMGYLGASANLGVGIGPLIASQMIQIGWRSIYVLFIGITIFGFTYIISARRPPQKVPNKSGIHLLFSQLSLEIRRIVVIVMIFSALLISHTYLAINIWTSKILSGPPPIIDEGIVGLVLGIAGVGSAITGFLTGITIKKKGILIPIIVGSIFLFISLTVFLSVGDITQESVFMVLAIGWIFAGLAGGILFPALTYYSQILSPERRGALAGLLTAGYFIGIALVPFTLAPISDIFGETGIYISILLISILFVFILLVLYVLAKRIKISN
jgi:DHA1 family bicyclomycin/chloramphenicol resistance-like MFS transporter